MVHWGICQDSSVKSNRNLFQLRILWSYGIDGRLDFGNRKKSRQLQKIHKLEIRAQKRSPSRNGDTIKAPLLEWTLIVSWLSLILLKIDIPGRKHLIVQSQVTWPPPGHQQKDLAEGVPGTPMACVVQRVYLGSPSHPDSIQGGRNLQNDSWVLLWRWNKYRVAKIPSSCPLSLLYGNDILSCDSIVWFENADVCVIHLI